jgi:maltooligosyltrehalose trehalohydrolase
MKGSRRTYGACLLAPDKTRFRLWAPDCAEVGVEIEDLPETPMSKMGNGWFEVEAPCGAGARYKFRVSPDLTVADPASDAQAGDVHGASIVVDHAAYKWRNTAWRGRPWHETVIYELHVGALGGFKGVISQLLNLVDLGVTAVELMPIAAFSGPHNWGYDGTLLYAPDSTYGSPDDLKLLIDTAHGLGLMVFLDVVYNHFGPEGNYLSAYARDFYRHDRNTPWGDALDFRRPQVRNFFIENAMFWVGEYRFDGLRFDAVHAIGDNDFLLEMSHRIRDSAPDRHIHLMLENELNEAALLRTSNAPGNARPGFEAQWADDLHHCIHVLLTGQKDAYYEDFADNPQGLLARCLSEGFAYQGERSRHRSGPRGTPSRQLPSTAFIICLQNHDQIGNRAFGERLAELSHPMALRAATALLLLTPQIPLLFMGQEWAASTPFLYFSGYKDELAEAVAQGRRDEFARFADFADPERRLLIPDPNDAKTFQSSVINPAEMSQSDHAAWLKLHRMLLAIRTIEVTPRIPGAKSIEASPLGQGGARVCWRMGDGTILTIAVNLIEQDVECPPPPGRIIFATSPRADPARLPGTAIEATLSGEADVQ